MPPEEVNGMRLVQFLLVLMALVAVGVAAGGSFTW